MTVVLVRYSTFVAGVRARSIAYAIAYMKAEDIETNYCGLGPVNKVLNMLCMWNQYGLESPEFRNHCLRVEDYLWYTIESRSIYQSMVSSIYISISISIYIDIYISLYLCLYIYIYIY